MKSRKPFVAGNGKVTVWFDLHQVQPLIEHARASTAPRLLDIAEPGLVLIGDVGVYLMSNGDPPQVGRSGDSPVVLYATGCDPARDAFEQWWEIHTAVDGGNDFTFFIPLSEFDGVLPECRECFSVVIGPEYISVRRDPR